MWIVKKRCGERFAVYELTCFFFALWLEQRFGSQTEWMSFIDTDEYLVPMKGASWTDVLNEMKQKDMHVLKLRSSRGMPRHDLME